MIKNWDHHDLHMDFSSMYQGKNHPSDIDMVYIGKDKFLIVGEIKNEQGRLTDGQRRLLQTFVDGWEAKGIAIYITHDKYVQYGDTDVNVAECYVQEIYYKGRGWTHPKRRTTVRDIIAYYGGQR